VRSTVLALIGPSGSGKSATAAVLARRFGWATLDEAYYRLTPRPRLTWTSPAALRALELRLVDEEARRFGEARRLVAEGRTVVADTSFLDPVGYTAGLLALGQATPRTFRAVVARARHLAAARRLGVPDLTVRLAVAAATRKERAAGDPTRHPWALRARHEAVGRLETSVLVPCLRRALAGRLRTVRAGAPVEAVAERIRAVAEGTTPLHDPYTAAVRTLDALVRAPWGRRGPASSGNLKRGTPSPRPPR